MKRLISTSALAGALLCLATGAQAIQGFNVTNTFPSLPAVGDWSTYSVPGNGGTYLDAAAIDTGITNLAATTINTVLPTSSTTPPSTANPARYNTTGQYLQTRPTGTAGAALMTTLNNDSGSAISQVIISYDVQNFNEITTEDAVGWRVFYSMSGAAQTWIPIPELTGAAAGARSATLNLPSALATGANMYILWFDDNANTGTDGSWTLDNFFATAGGPATPIAITVQPPASVTTTQSLSATWDLTVTGSTPAFQWYREEGGVYQPVPGATGARITIAQTTLADDTNFYCVVQNSINTVTSTVTRLTVTPDAIRPTLVSASLVNDGTRTRFLITWSEPMDLSSMTNQMNYDICNAEISGECLQMDATVLATYLSPTSCVLKVDNATPAVQGLRYLVSGYAVRDLAGLSEDQTSATTGVIPYSWRQGTADYFGCQDAELKSGTIGGLYRGNIAQGSAAGGDTNFLNILVDNADSGGPSQALIKFDNIIGGDAGQIPANANIISAQLRLVSTADNANTAGPLYIFLMLQDWNQDAATWDVPLLSGNNGSPGVQNDGVEAALVPVSSRPGPTLNPNGNGPQTILFDITAAVQAWAYGTPNHGFVMTNSNTDGYRFDSSETNELTRPELLVSYDLTQPPVVVTNFVLRTNNVTVTPATNNVTIDELGSFSITFGVGGFQPQFQWYKVVGGVTNAILNETNAVISRNPALRGDAADYYLRAFNGTSSTNTPKITININADTVAPSIASVVTQTNRTTVVVSFSEGMAVGPAGTAGNYVINIAGGGTVAVSSVALSNNNSVAYLTLGTALADGSSYSLTVNAAVTDLAGNVLTNPSQAVPIPVLLIPFTAAWAYTDLGNDLGSAWLAQGYDTSSWSNGPALFVAKRGTVGAYATNVFGTTWTTMQISNNPPTVQVLTYYFRAHFELNAEPAGVASLSLRTVLDDGAVFYVNGQEAFSQGMPTNSPANRPVLYNTAATRTQGNDYAIEGVFNIPATNIVNGDNVFAVEVHQVNNTSSDAAFAAELTANVTSFSAARPRMSASFDGSSVIISWTGTGTLLQSDSVNGPWSPIAGATSPYTVSAPLAAKKFYRIQQ